MKIMTGKTGTPHVTSQQFRQFVEATVGQDSYILQSGENLEPELQTNNSLKIRSGIMAHHGNLSVVDLGTYDEVTIANGTQGRQRIDLVVNRYTRDESTGEEENEWVVIQGAAVTSNPAEPSYIEGNLQNGDLVDDCPVFRIHLNGINVTKVEKLLDVAPSIPTLNASLAEKEPIQNRGNRNGYYYKAGYNCFMHITDALASSAVTALASALRPISAVSVSGMCRNISTGNYYPCVGSIAADGTWNYLSALESIGADSVYYIYSASNSIDRRSNFRVWLTGAWATNVNGS